MKARTLLLSLALCLSGAAVCFAQDPNIGTWKLNEAKSKIPAGAMKVTSMTVSSEGDNIKIAQDGTDKDGNVFHAEWTGKFDGKDYPVTGSPVIDTRSYTKVNDHTLTAENKKDGKTVQVARSTISADGKTRTVHVTQTDASGKKVNVTAVFDKE
jgi:hypothetical protein